MGSSTIIRSILNLSQSEEKGHIKIKPGEKIDFISEEKKINTVADDKNIMLQILPAISAIK